MENPNTDKTKKLTIHNKISNNFRELHVDGAYGGITARGLLNINFYAERLPIPKSTDYNIIENKLDQPIANSPDSKTGLIREFETGVYMTIETAKDFHKWLGDQIGQFEEIKDKFK